MDQPRLVCLRNPSRIHAIIVIIASKANCNESAHRRIATFSGGWAHFGAYADTSWAFADCPLFRSDICNAYVWMPFASCSHALMLMLMLTLMLMPLAAPWFMAPGLSRVPPSKSHAKLDPLQMANEMTDWAISAQFRCLGPEPCNESCGYLPGWGTGPGRLFLRELSPSNIGPRPVPFIHAPARPGLRIRPRGPNSKPRPGYMKAREKKKQKKGRQWFKSFVDCVERMETGPNSSSPWGTTL